MGEARGSQGEGATITIENQHGELLGLGSAAGRQGFPPAAKLEVTHYSAQEIHGVLTGTLYVSGYAQHGPPRLAHVPVEVVFKARSSTSPGKCQ
ncbi:MAG: hypothetical protein HKM89_13735 [Gemmatimonadales bacterium]|nr:hypothetical protein [Gemmatimonadales bacterium]